MKRILITHITNTLNYGSAMMAINLIAGLRKHFSEQDLEIYCECDNYHLARLKVGTGDESLKNCLLPKEDRGSKLGKVNKYLFGKSKTFEYIGTQFDTMIVLGGDDLSESYMMGAMIAGLNYYHINKKCTVILAGQSLGPFSGMYKFLASFIFRNISVITRDDNSYKFTVNDLKAKNVLQSRDLALTDLPKQDRFNEIINKKNLTEKKYIVVVLSGLVHHYTNDVTGYIKTWKKIVSNLIDKYPTYRIVMLGHVLSPKHADDTVIINEVYSAMSDEKKKHLIKLTEEIQPAEARAILGESRFVITGRMHAAVSTLFMGKPAIALAYSEKYDGVISKGLKLPELVVDCRNQQWGDESQIIEKVMKKVVDIEDNYFNLKQKISFNVDECSQMVNSQIEYIVKKINDK